MRVNFHVAYTIAEKTPSTKTGELYGIFGLDPEQGTREYVKPFSLDVAEGNIVLFTGVSGTGKTSCLRQFMKQTDAFDLDSIELRSDKTVAEQLGNGDMERGVTIAGMAGLGEAQLFLRFPTELSDGQRYRFKIAKAIADGHKVIACDEFCATLDRVTAKTISFNLRKLATREGLTLALATTHTDIIEDLQADHVVTFSSSGAEVARGKPFRRQISFYDELAVERGTRTDWQHFAPWHYRGHTIGFVKAVWVLTHNGEKVGIIVQGLPALQNSVRNRIFKRTRWDGRRVNKTFAALVRIVIDPRYRGAGVAADFVRAVCKECVETRYVEVISSLGRATQMFQRAGFVDAGGLSTGGDGVYGTGDLMKAKAAKAAKSTTGHSGSTYRAPKITTASTRAQSSAAQMRLYFMDRKALGWWEEPAKVAAPK